MKLPFGKMKANLLRKKKNYFFYNRTMVNNIRNMNPIEFNSFIKQLRQQYKQKAVEQKEEKRELKKQEKEQKKQTAEKAAELKKKQFYVKNLISIIKVWKSKKKIFSIIKVWKSKKIIFSVIKIWKMKVIFII